MILASEETFNSRGGLYWPPYEEQDRTEYVEARAVRLIAEYGQATFVIGGCATADLVDSLRRKNARAFGFDASEWILARSIPAAQDYLFVCDITQLPHVRSILTLTRRAKAEDTRPTIVVTEDLLSCLTTEEARVAADNLRRCMRRGDQALHLVTCSNNPGERPGDRRLTWGTVDMWRELAAPQRVEHIGVYSRPPLPGEQPQHYFATKAER